MNRFYRTSDGTALRAPCPILSSSIAGRWSSRIAAARALAPENTIAAFDQRPGARRRRPRARRAPVARRRGRRPSRPDARADDQPVGSLVARHGRRAGARRRRYHFAATTVAVSRPGHRRADARPVLRRYASRDHRRAEGATARRWRAPSSTSSAGRRGRSRVPRVVRAAACCARPARSSRRIATSAAREEVRWALYRSWCRWPVVAGDVRGYQVPEIAGRDARRLAALRRACAPRRAWRPGLDGERRSRRAAPAAWGV